MMLRRQVRRHHHLIHIPNLVQATMGHSSRESALRRWQVAQPRGWCFQVHLLGVQSNATFTFVKLAIFEVGLLLNYTRITETRDKQEGIILTNYDVSNFQIASTLCSFIKFGPVSSKLPTLHIVY